jgi:iron complex outermembrane receptor protein
MNDWTFQAGIQNLFDERPPAQSSSQSFRVGTAALNAYDVIGRRGFVQVTRRF